MYVNRNFVIEFLMIVYIKVIKFLGFSFCVFNIKGVVFWMGIGGE